MKSAVLISLLLPLALASPLSKDATATKGQPYAGSSTADVYPPTGVSANSALFPKESQIGFPGPTPTGLEPNAIQTAPAYPYNDRNAGSFPLVTDTPLNGTSSFDISKYWGNLAPWYSVNSSSYGLPDATPLTPDSCSITQVHLLYRHGARYPTSGALPSVFAAALHSATANGSFVATGDLSFLNTWTYNLGAELLTPFGRLQNFELGVQSRQLYGHLLNNFTSQAVLPVFRTQSQDRMVKTANNFAAGFFGVPEYLDEVNIEIVVEGPGSNNTGAPYTTCPNSNVASKGSIGSTVATKFMNDAFNSTIDRLQGEISGFTITPSHIVSMLQLCSYETSALGYSAFCGLFSEQDFKNYEYYYDLIFYYNNGYGSPVSAAQGLGYLQEFVARFEHTPISSYNSTTNSTLDSNPTTFPLNQSIYADATHEVVVLDTLSAFNLSALFQSGPLPLQRDDGHENSFKASQTVPFGTHFVVQVMECSDMKPTKQIRFIVNDAVLPLDQTYPGCPWNANGICAFDTVVSALKKRIQEIDFDYACFGTYTAEPGVDYNGLPPPRG